MSLLGTCLLLVFQASHASVREALQADDYPAAWAIAEAEPDVLAQWRGRCEILYAAGDPAASLAAARRGLVSSPEDLLLLFRATGAALWLQEVRSSREYLRRLGSALDRAQLTAEEARGWREALQDLTARTQDLERHDSELERALGRTIRLSLACLFAALAFVCWMGVWGYGRSSRPVS